VLRQQTKPSRDWPASAPCQSPGRCHHFGNLFWDLLTRRKRVLVDAPELSLLETIYEEMRWIAIPAMHAGERAHVAGLPVLAPLPSDDSTGKPA
jgi:hypothetical protein